MAAAGVNFIDIYQRSGWYKVPLPAIPGNEGAGVVEAVGEGVTDVAIGERGGVVRRVRLLCRVCAGAGRQAGAAACHAQFRAGRGGDGAGHHRLRAGHVTYPLKPGDRCLVHAAAGGVGLLLCQLAKQAGAFVIGTTSTPEKAALARRPARMKSSSTPNRTSSRRSSGSPAAGA